MKKTHLFSAIIWEVYNYNHSIYNNGLGAHINEVCGPDPGIVEPNCGMYCQMSSGHRLQDVRVILGIQSPKLRMDSWNLNTLRFGGDYTPQSSSDKESQDSYGGNLFI